MKSSKPHPPICRLQQGQTILFEGDSLTSRRVQPALDTWPFARLCHWDRTYADDVAEWLFCNRPDLSLTCRNNAISGSNIRALLSRFEAIVPVVRPAWIILTIGNNDPNQGLTVEEFDSAFRQYCQRAREMSNSRVMLLGGQRPAPPDQQDFAVYFAKSVPYHECARGILAGCDGVFVDIGAVLTRRFEALHRQHPSHTVYSDGTHLNAIGNLIVATQVLAALGVVQLVGEMDPA